MQTFFQRDHSTDIIKVGKKQFLRGCIASLYKYDIPILTEHPKQILYPLAVDISDPYDFVDETTDIQNQLRDFNILAYGSVAYSCACGSGKTLAGLHLIYKLKCKTLIISARCAVNHQWLKQIAEKFPHLKICTLQNTVEDPDIWIYTPQYLIKHLDMKLPVSLIIYDEIHTLVSEEFSKVIEYPFLNCANSANCSLNCSGNNTQLPFLMSLSATFPIEESAKRLINKVFGKPIQCKSRVTEIPVYYKLFSGLKYNDEYETIKTLVSVMAKENIGNNHGIIMTHTIQASIYAGLYIHDKWHVDVLILRAENEQSYYLPANEEINGYCIDTTLEDLHESNLGKYVDNPFDVAELARVICGTSMRIKEGFSVQSLTWGIATKFVWSINSRIQMLGRIRRWSDNQQLNETRRIFLAGMGKPPVDYNKKKYFHKNVVDYDFKLEEELFKAENYCALTCYWSF
jgi:hypothetical protein